MQDIHNCSFLIVIVLFCAFRVVTHVKFITLLSLYLPLHVFGTDGCLLVLTLNLMPEGIWMMLGPWMLKVSPLLQYGFQFHYVCKSKI